MKLRLWVSLVPLLLIWITSAWADEAAAQKPQTPHMLIAEKDFRFDPVVDGSTVTHDYRVKNTGEGTLEISQVKTG
jgi:hypothetical protein